MQPKDILDKMAKLESVFGVGARMYANDPVMGHKFICECYQELMDATDSTKEHFGVDILREIELYVEQHPCSS